MSRSILPDVELEEVHEPTDNELKSVMAQAREQYRLDQLVITLEEDLKKAKNDLRDLRERELPMMLQELGMRGVTLGNGYKLDLETNVYAAIPKDRLDEANTWLEEHEHADLIKRTITIEFGRDEEKWAAKFQRDCAQRKKPLKLAMKRAVHFQTMQKTVREWLVLGLSFPEDLFGVHRQKITVLTPPKKDIE